MLTHNDTSYNGDTLSKNSVPILVLTILKTKTDENHQLNAADLKKILEKKYGVTVDRRTIYSAINQLNSLGYDISDFEETGKGYYLRERQFEPNEIAMLLCAITAFPFISEKQTKELMTKLQADLSEYSKTSVNNLMIVRPDNKSLNNQVLTNIALICDAIEQKKKISFTYLEIGPDLKLVPKRDKKYTVNPYGIVYANENLYLVCTYAFKDTPSLYRLDMIKDIEIRQYDKDDPLPTEELRQKLKRMVYAHPGESTTFTLRAEKKYLRDIVDEFGSGIIVDNEGDYIRATVHGTKIGMTYWCMQYLQHIEVINPPEFRQEIIDLLKNNIYMQ